MRSAVVWPTSDPVWQDFGRLEKKLAKKLQRRPTDSPKIISQNNLTINHAHRSNPLQETNRHFLNVGQLSTYTTKEVITATVTQVITHTFNLYVGHLPQFGRHTQVHSHWPVTVVRYRLCFCVCSPFQRQAPGNHRHTLRETHGKQHLRSEHSRVSHLHPLF